MTRKSKLSRLLVIGNLACGCAARWRGVRGSALQLCYAEQVTRVIDTGGAGGVHRPRDANQQSLDARTDCVALYFPGESHTWTPHSYGMVGVVEKATYSLWDRSRPAVAYMRAAQSSPVSMNYSIIANGDPLDDALIALRNRCLQTK